MVKVLKRIVAVLMVVIIAGISGSAPAHGDPYTQQLCVSNPAYRSMHENECDLGEGNGGSGHQRQGGGLIGSILRGLGHLL